MVCICGILYFVVETSRSEWKRFSLSDMTNGNMSANIIYLMLFQTNYRQKEKQILDKILDQEVYDSRMRPTGINSTGSLVFYARYSQTRKLIGIPPKINFFVDLAKQILRLLLR